MTINNLFVQWIKDVVLVWLTRIYKIGKIHSKRREIVLDKAVATFKDKLLHIVYETYGRLLIDQLFNIIIGAHGVTFLVVLILNPCFFFFLISLLMFIFQSIQIHLMQSKI